MRQSGELLQVEPRKHRVCEHAGDENCGQEGGNDRSCQARASHVPPATAIGIVENGGVRETHISLDVRKVGCGVRCERSSSKWMIKKPSTIETVDGFGELLGLA